MKKVYLMDVNGDRGYLYYYKVEEVRGIKIKLYDQLAGGSFEIMGDEVYKNNNMIQITEAEYNMIVTMYDLFNETGIESIADNIKDTIEVIIYKYEE